MSEEKTYDATEYYAKYNEGKFYDAKYATEKFPSPTMQSSTSQNIRKKKSHRNGRFKGKRSLPHVCITNEAYKMQSSNLSQLSFNLVGYRK